MAKPKIFVSSTYYDLKHVRASLDVFISSLGFDPILSEKGQIAYAPDLPLDESCYREAQACDIFVLLIGGRYGSAASSEATVEKEPSFYERYESITKQEYKAALEQDIPIYIMVESGVYGEYQTFKKNRENDTIKYAHVDSVNIFGLIDDIIAQKRNNPVKSFERYSEIEDWLKDQWAGLFGELLNRRGNQSQLTSLAAQVGEMSEVNQTLRRYIEMIVSQLAPDKSQSLIASENERLEVAMREEKLKSLHVLEWIESRNGIGEDAALQAILKARSMVDLKNRLEKTDGTRSNQLERMFKDSDFGAFLEMNEIRHLYNLPELKALED